MPELAENRARQDAESVRRLKAAGAHFMGKTNVPFGLADLQSYNAIYGTTGNPWDLERTPGGSSGGSAAALAAGLTALDAGSDIGGSIRNPAHYCGVYGHKPTWGIVPPQGHSTLHEPTPAVDIAVCGPLARSAGDLRLALDVLAGPEPLRAPAWRLELPEPSWTDLRDLRVAIWPSEDRAPVAAEVAERVREVGRRLERLGATVSDDARPAIDLGEAHETYLTLLHSVMSAEVSDEQYARNERYAAATDPDDRSDTAIMSRAMVLSHRDWLRTSRTRERLRHAWRAFFDQWDILICPQTATPAFPRDHRKLSQRTLEVDGSEQPYFQQLFWAGLVTAPYLPSTVFPTGLSAGGLPIGLQAVGAEHHDYATIRFAERIAAELGGFTPPPLAGLEQ